jgi:hypothetical protein
VIGRTSIRWHLVAWVTGVLLAALALTFVVVYERTGEELRTQIDHDVAGDIAQLSQAVRGLPARSPSAVLGELGAYVRAQPYTGTSSLLFAAIAGHGSVSNHPELLGSSQPDDGENQSEQTHENALGQALLTGPTGLTTRPLPDVGKVRLDERIVSLGNVRVRVAAGEALIVVVRAKRGIAKSFVIAGALALALALIASYLAGATLSRPLRRLAGRRARRRGRSGSPDAPVCTGRQRGADPRRLVQPHARSPLPGVRLPAGVHRRRVP